MICTYPDLPPWFWLYFGSVFCKSDERAPSPSVSFIAQPRGENMAFEGMCEALSPMPVIEVPTVTLSPWTSPGGETPTRGDPAPGDLELLL